MENLKINLPNKLSEIKNTRYVVKSNHLISRACQLAPKSQKLFTIFVALMNSERTVNSSGNLCFWLTLREISQLMEIDRCKNYKKEIVNLINELESGKMFELDKNTFTHFISSVKFTDDGRVYFEFPTVLHQHIGRVKGAYTMYPLKTILPLKTAYGIKIYELLKKDSHRGKATYDLEYFRTYLNIPKDKYVKFSHFRNKVLLPALNEVNYKTEITALYKLLKATGKKTFVGIEFEIRVNMKDLKDFEAKIQQELALTSYKRFNPEQIPYKALNTPQFNSVYQGFIENMANFPPYWTFENYVLEGGFKIVRFGNAGGKDIIIDKIKND